MSKETSLKAPEGLWEQVVELVKNRFSTENDRSKMERYFPLFLSHEFTENTLHIAVAEALQVEWFTSLFTKPIESALHELGHADAKVVFDIAEAAQSAHAQKPSFAPPAAAFLKQSAAPALMGMPSTLPLTENYTFQNFVVGPSNSFAHATAMAVANGPGRTLNNPLFIYGGTGLGKTHLMQSIGHYVLKNNPSASVCYITSETFLNEYVNALANNAMQAFRERYRKVDVLLLDDVQFIADKRQFQEEFFNTFSSLMTYRKQVVMTSDVAPKDLKGCEERLIGRFQQGMAVEIEAPSYETRLAILKFKVKMQSSGRIIPEEILKYIAENIRSHVRALEGAISRVITFMELNANFPMTLEIVQHLLKDSIEQEKTIKDLTVEEIIKVVTEFYNVTLSDILSPQRTQTLVTPRQVAMFLSYKLTTRSLTEIGRSFGKTHATVYHGAQTIQKRIDVENDLRKAVENITSQLGRNPSELTK